jgi:superfamily II DNA or RNA helicase
VMAALDYVRLRQQLPRSRLLFVAHREEILTKSRDTFRVALRDATFGEDWVGGRRPSHFDHVFASIQSLSATDLDLLAADHFDVVIVDEFHHAAATSYERILAHLRPRELLGLTATPERADGLSVLKWFDGRIAAELRLWDAIDQQRLAPFVYYGIHDGVDLTAVTWRRGTGYDTTELTNVLTRDHVVAHLVLKQLQKHVDSLESMRALGFCVSVEHARFMARQFNAAGVQSIAVWTDTPDDVRRAALRDLAAGNVKVVFSVDLFNEGIDVPTVDTLLMLRPTESATLFLQQLGRGLRKSTYKTSCTVLDFVGQHRKEFRYDKRFRALLGGTRKSVMEQIATGFPLLPAGCHMELDRVASAIVLDSIKRAVPTTWGAKVAALQEGVLGTRPRLVHYLASTDLDLEDIYGNNRSWSDLLQSAGFPVASTGPKETALRRALGRLLHIDDAERISRYSAWLQAEVPPNPESLPARDIALLRMLVVSLAETALDGRGTLNEGLALVWAHPQVRAEAVELMEVLEERVEHVPMPLTMYPNAPLNIHAQYTRLEILAGIGLGSGIETPQWREGVYWAREAKADLLAFTLDKSSGRFSPTTRYRDYAINPTLIHWESQSGTKSTSPTGTRYQTHVQQGSTVLLFARLSTEDRAFYFLGPAEYVSHESEAPMAITWRLGTPLSGDLFASFAAAVA